LLDVRGHFQRRRPKRRGGEKVRADLAVATDVLRGSKEPERVPRQERLLRFPAVQELIPYSHSQIYLMIKAGRFPKPVKLGGGRAVAWRLSAILAYIESRKEA
jgi:prophage regulatory protein